MTEAYFLATQPPPIRNRILNGHSVRLRAIRAALGYDNASAFARTVGIGITNWSNFENGRPLSISAAQKLVQRFPSVTLDSLYRGRTDLLPVDLARRIEAELVNLQPDFSTSSGRPKAWARGRKSR